MTASIETISKQYKDKQFRSIESMYHHRKVARLFQERYSMNLFAFEIDKISESDFL